MQVLQPRVRRQQVLAHGQPEGRRARHRQPRQQSQLGQQLQWGEEQGGEVGGERRL